jgi:hypothetical protein
MAKTRETVQASKIGNIDDYYFGLVEAFEFCDIFRAFQNEDQNLSDRNFIEGFQAPIAQLMKPSRTPMEET